MGMENGQSLQELRLSIIKEFDLDLTKEEDRQTLKSVFASSTSSAIQNPTPPPTEGPFTRRIKDMTGKY